LRIVALLLAFVALAAPALADEPPAAPSEAPASEEPVFAALDGRTVRASDHRGQVVLLNFWATYCGPCRTEMPQLQSLHESLGPQGLRVQGAAANGRDEGEAVRRSMSQLGATFDTWLWVSAKDMRHYGVGPGLPATVILDRQGRVRHRVQGVVQAAALTPLLRELLAEPAPATAAPAR
jgi:thiol-disulfide isomerase/thioredoxin